MERAVVLQKNKISMKKLLFMLLLLALPVLAQHECCSYKATIISVYDGDTVTAGIYLGLNVYIEQKLRLHGINAPELRGAERMKGQESRDALRNKISKKDVIIKTLNDKRGKYGRLIATIYLDGVNINEWLVSNGYAVHKDY